MRVLAAEFLDRRRGPPVRVALSQHRVDGAAQNLGKAGLQGFFFLGLGLFGVIRDCVTFSLQLADRLFQLRHRGADIGQFDDIGLRQLDQPAQLSQVVGNFLLFTQVIREIGDDPAGQGDVLGHEIDPGALGEGPEDGKQRIGGQGRGLIDGGVDDLGCGHDFSLAESRP
jgi:hypothetical protein